MSDHNLAEVLRECAVIRAAVSNDDTMRALVRLQRVEMAIKTALAAHSPKPASGTSDQQAGEAVAWVFKTRAGYNDVGYDSLKLNKLEHGTKLFTHPQQPLADEQMRALRPLPFSNAELDRLYANIPPTAQQDARSREAFKRIARCVEAAHGITKDTK